MHPLALYIHWPFCLAKCPYCDFNSHVRATVDHAQWQQALIADMAHEAALLPGLVGWGRTRLLLYTGDSIDARTALDWGLVEKAVPAAELDAAVDGWVASIVASGPQAIRLQKELIREWEAMPVGEAIEAGIRCMVRAYQTDEPKRMVGETIRRLKARKPDGSR